MKRILILTAILVMCLACSESKPPSPNKLEPIVQEIPIRYEIPAHIPHALAKRYSYVQNDMLEPEWQAFLQYIYDLCLADTHHTVIDLHLKRAVSEGAYNHAKDLPHPAATYDDRSRIVVASWFKNRSVKVAFDPDPTGLKVIYWRAKYIVLLEFYETERGRGWHLNTPPIGGPAAPLDQPRHAAVLDQILEDWEDKGEVNIPDVVDELKTAFILIDKADGLPVQSKFKDWIVHFDVAPRATDEQISEYNRRHSPSAYDCVEGHPPSS